jgi:sporulation protein YlmC with PRC-barrel domain
MTNLPMTAEVHCSDGPCGRLVAVIVHPTMNKVSNLVVKERRQPQREHLVPIWYVADCAEDLIRLSCTRQKLSEMKEFVQTEVVQSGVPGIKECSQYMLQPYVVPRWIPTRHGLVPRDELVISKRARVRTTMKDLGHLHRFVVDLASGDITHVVMRDRQFRDREETTIPVSAIERIGEGAVFLRMDRSGIQESPSISRESRNLSHTRSDFPPM